MAKAKTPYASPAWGKVRRQVLERDRYLCQVQSDVCTRKATEADHIEPWRDGGDWFAPSNLRASCKQCNISRASHQKHYAGWKRSPTHIIVVEGDDQDRPLTDHISVDTDDIVLDADRLVAAVAPAEIREQHRHTAAVAWDALLRELIRGELQAPRVWLLTTDTDAGQKFPNHELIRVGKRGEPDGGEEEGGGSQGLHPEEDRWS